MNTPLHVVLRDDGMWQVEREDDLIPLSVHEDRDAALDAALLRAMREHRGIAMHRRPRRRAGWADMVVWAILHREEEAEFGLRHRRAG